MVDVLLTAACQWYPQSAAGCFGQAEAPRLFDEFYLKINKTYEKIQGRITVSPQVRWVCVDDLQLSRYIK